MEFGEVFEEVGFGSLCRGEILQSQSMLGAHSSEPGGHALRGSEAIFAARGCVP